MLVRWSNTTLLNFVCKRATPQSPARITNLAHRGYQLLPLFLTKLLAKKGVNSSPSYLTGEIFKVVFEPWDSIDKSWDSKNWLQPWLVVQEMRVGENPGPRWPRLVSEDLGSWVWRKRSPGNGGLRAGGQSGEIPRVRGSRGTPLTLPSSAFVLSCCHSGRLDKKCDMFAVIKLFLDAKDKKGKVQS